MVAKSAHNGIARRLQASRFAVDARRLSRFARVHDAAYDARLSFSFLLDRSAVAADFSGLALRQLAAFAVSRSRLSFAHSELRAR